MYASILSTLKERTQESAMMQILGATKSLIAKILVIEFGVLGFFASSVASVMALILATDLASRYFDLSFTLHLKWYAFGVLLSTPFIVLFGLLGARSLFRVSPLVLVRSSS
jgi:putative ABC transport system permease protein